MHPNVPVNVEWCLKHIHHMQWMWLLGVRCLLARLTYAAHVVVNIIFQVLGVVHRRKKDPYYVQIITYTQKMFDVCYVLVNVLGVH